MMCFSVSCMAYSPPFSSILSYLFFLSLFKTVILYARNMLPIALPFPQNTRSLPPPLSKGETQQHFSLGYHITPTHQPTHVRVHHSLTSTRRFLSTTRSIVQTNKNSDKGNYPYKDYKKP